MSAIMSTSLRTASLAVALVAASSASLPDAAVALPGDRLVLGGHLLIPVRESAEFGSSCSAPGTTACDGTGLSYDSVNVTGSGRLDVEGFGLLRLGATTRAGLALTLHPGVQFASTLSGSTKGFGAVVDPMLLAEWIPELAPSVRWLVQARIGFRTLFTGADLDKEIGDAKSACSDARTDGLLCTVDEGPYSGFALGAGTGLLWTVGAITWRAQLVWTVTEIDHLAHLQAAGAKGTIDMESRIGGGDGWTTLSLALGAEY